jgi:NAD-dependent DNA ligase
LNHIVFVELLQDGRFMSCLSRGNGREGEDLTEAAEILLNHQNLPRSFPQQHPLSQGMSELFLCVRSCFNSHFDRCADFLTGCVEIRCEILMTKKEFERLNSAASIESDASSASSSSPPSPSSSTESASNPVGQTPRNLCAGLLQSDAKKLEANSRFCMH